jgi:hypothetical protein
MSKNLKDGIENAITLRNFSQTPNYYFFGTEKEDKIQCNFYLIKCSIDDILETEFISGISNLIIQYALKKDEYSDLSGKNAFAIVKKAVSRFVTSNTTGEPGELILFSLLETEKKAPQLINKMSLKTSKQMHYHGLDGIHIGVENGEIILYFGESKMYQSFHSAVDNAIDDLNEFHNSAEKEKFELNLISNNIDVSKFKENVEEIKKIVDPYSSYDKSQLRKKYVVFIGCNWDCIQKIDFKKITENISGILENCINTNRNKIFEKCKSKVKSSDINLIVEFFIIPFKDVQRIRTMFLEEMKFHG